MAERPFGEEPSTTMAPYVSDPSSNTFTNLQIGQVTPTVIRTAYIQASAGDLYQIKGDFLNYSNQNTLWDTHAATLDFISNGNITSHTFALAGADMGQHRAGYTDNFAWAA